MLENLVGKCVRWWLGFGLSVAFAACSVPRNEDDTRSVQQTVTACDNASIFGFEAASQWSGTGASVAVNTRRMQGNYSIRAQGSPHMELRSAAACSSGATYDLIAFSVAGFSSTSPSSQANVSVRFDSASHGIAGAALGARLIRIPENGYFTRVELPISATLSATLASAYSDLRITISFDAVLSSAQDYLVDDLSLRVGASVAAAPPQSISPVLVSFALPSTSDVLQLGLLGQNVSISDRVTVAQSGGGFGALAATDSVITDIGVQAKVGTVTSVASVRLRDRATVTGNVVTSGTIDRGVSVTVTGQSQPAAVLTPLKTIKWNVDFQVSSVPVQLEPNVVRSLAPGGYGAVSIKAGAKLTLSTGSYYFDSFSAESNGQVILINDSGPVMIYVRNGLTLRGTWQFLGRVGDLLLVALSPAPVAVETPFDGTLVATQAAVRLGVGSVPHAGAVFAKAVLLDPGVSFSARPALPLLGAIGGSQRTDNNKGACAASIVSGAYGQANTARATQEAILRYCGGSDLGPCETALMAQLNLDYYLAATQLVKGTLVPSKHLAFMLDRERKTAQFHGNEALACQIINNDADGDYVPTPRDTCPGTPAFTATFDNGCTDTASPAAPPIADILAGLPSLAVSGDARCNGAPSPIVPSPFGAWRYPPDPSAGKALWISKDPDTSGCPIWYIFQGQLTDGSLQTIAFLPAQDVTLPWLKRADNILQFNIHQSEGGGRGAWANYGVFTKQYRVQAVNAAGRKSSWSNWFKPGQESCAAGACPDF